MNRRGLRLVTAVTVLALAALACGGGGAGERPTVTISSPPNGMVVTVGQEVQIISMAAAEAGVERVELAVNGEVVRSDMPPEGNPTSFSMAQPWTPLAEGEVTVVVVAYDTSGAASEPAVITLQVQAGTGAVTEEPGPTPTAMPDVMGEGGCTLNASYVADVTIPDDTELAPGTSFVKTWRLRNSGSCDWEDGFELIFVSGEPMGGPVSVVVPATAAGSMVDVSVNLVAPGSPGTYRGNWRMRSDTGTVFGTQVYVQIVVPEPATSTPNPTDTPGPTDTASPPSPTFAPVTFAPLPMTYVFVLRSVEEVGNQTTLSPGEVDYVTASCPANSIVVSGGYATNSDVLVYTQLMDGNGWRVAAKNNSTSHDRVLFAYANCLSGTGGSVTQVVDQVTVASNAVGHPVAACPQGSVVTGGGWATNPNGTLRVYNSTQNGNDWQVYVENVGGTAELANAYAICLSGVSGTTNLVLEQDTVPAGGTLGVVATCEGSDLAVGGGFAVTPDSIVYNSSLWSSENHQWIVYSRNPSGSTQLMNSYAVCLSYH